MIPQRERMGAGLRIAFLAAGDPGDKRAQSGSLYYMARALEQHVEEIHFCEPIGSIEKQAARLLDSASRRLLKRRVAYDHLELIARKHGRIACQRLQERPADVILAVMNPVDVAHLETDVPVILVLDSTFALQRNYYPQFTNLWEWSSAQALRVERRAYDRAAALVLASSWAARSAAGDYGVRGDKIHVACFGANLDRVPSSEIVMNKARSSRCRLLFVGVGWEEKGGSLAFETLVRLGEMGVDAELVICGSIPPRRFSHDRMTVVPFLDKSDARQCAELHALYMNADFLLLPTRREAYGHVFCEASAFGVPSITSETGAVPEVVRDGENGYVLPYSARGDDYAQVIADVHADKERFRSLVASSRAAFDSRMNWDVWARSIKQIAETLRSRRDHPQTPASRLRIKSGAGHKYDGVDSAASCVITILPLSPGRDLG